ncbi:hypothetical protein PVAND_015504 [Polypedilum vanderplanki]|uniref:Reverse transcriptase domain-containing protein n=1 Tax=Polypedilum vanderplanki TaxID=319348 RepID=A0A9J6BCR9_POLVA|nr:hypothetical protein PVAND_015504 [Polypedilum vanderplanki]
MSILSTNVKIENYEKIEYNDIINEISDEFDFKLVSWNVRSIQKLSTFNKFKLYINRLMSKQDKSDGRSLARSNGSINVIDCIALTETWLNENDNLNTYTLKNYQNFHLKRKNCKRGGGISFYVHKKWNFHILESKITDYVEYLLVQLQCYSNHHKLLIVYRPPSGNHNSFIEWIDNITQVYTDLIIVGDININISENRNSLLYLDSLNSNGYDVINNFVTRNESRTIIDHIIISNSSFGKNCRFLKIFTMKRNFFSDHNMIVLVAKSSNIPRWTRTTITKLNFKNALDLIFNSAQICSNFENETQEVVSYELQQMIDMIKYCIDVSKESITLKHKDDAIVPPWFDYNYVKISSRIDNIQVKIDKLKKQNRPFSLLLKKRDELNCKLTIIDQNKGRAHYMNKLQNGKASVWGVINEITGRLDNKSNISLKTSKNLIIDDPQYVAIEFGKYFNDLTGKETLSDIKPVFIGPTNISTMFLTPVTEIEVCIEMNNLAVNKATGFDGIPPKIWKELCFSHAHTLTKFINYFLSNGMFPDCMKIAKVLPIYKSGDRSNVANYRGISILSSLSKIFEKILCKRINNFINHSKYHDKSQFGFRKGKGTSDAVAKLVSYVSNELDDNRYVISIFIDVKKAFDTVLHEILLFKLEKMGLRGVALEIISDYLKNRKQLIMLNGFSSDTYPVVQGVPQGSILGPLLFNLMISDMQNLKLKSNLVLYADDLSLTCSHSDMKMLEQTVRNDFAILKNYYQQNGFEINESKTKLMFYRNDSMQDDIKQLTEDLGIETVQHFKYLGVIIDKQLKFNFLIDDIAQKLSSSVRALNIIRYYSPTQCRLAFYNAFINSHLMFSAFLLTRVPKVGLKRLQFLQNKSLKICYSLPPLFSTVDLFEKYANNILPIAGMIYLNVLSLVHKCLIDSENDDFEKITSGRRAGSIKVLKFRHTVKETDILITGARYYNFLPASIKRICCLSVFRKKVTKLLLISRNSLINDTSLKGLQLKLVNEF